jgi:nitric oxide reductase NorD protein
MAFLTERKHPNHEILSLFPFPLYTGSHIYYEDDLIEMGLVKVLDGYPEEVRRVILGHAKTLSSIKAELAFHFLFKFHDLLDVIKLRDLEKWVNVVLDIYDSQGLNPAREFILRLEDHPDFARFWGKGVAFQQVYGVLSTYVHALGGDDIKLEGGRSHYTDTSTVYLPERIALFPDQETNFLLYKIMVTHKLAQKKLGTYRLGLNKIIPLVEILIKRYRQPSADHLNSDLSRFFHLFPDPLLAEDLFNLIETVRIEAWIETNFPGLHRRLKKLKLQLALKREISRELSPKSSVVEMLFRGWLTGDTSSLKNVRWTDILDNTRDVIGRASKLETTVIDTAQALVKLYGYINSISGPPYRRVDPIIYIGELRPEEAERGLVSRRESIRGKFRQELAKLVCELPDWEEVRIEVPQTQKTPQGDRTPQQVEIPKHLLINGNPVPLPEGLQKVVEEIYEDMGTIPSTYLAVTDDMSGHYFHSLCHVPEGTGYFLSEQGEGIHVLDEWDYRRQGYRKRWALLRETDVAAGSPEFVDVTLARYRGMIQRIKRQFERIRQEQTLLRRQKEGNDVDLDAAVESFSDRHAGLYPSDRVFISTWRDKRDIATAFLIDLSGSTSGWINEMERAALLILTEAMEVLRDRFSIYGFSGRTRKRCELYRIKGFDEPYGKAVKKRIAGLRPLEYTRLGPPIRRITELLRDEEAKTKLLISISDGKPDDYDGYKGDYGIEDTRQALLEAKRVGIHPFCITIDKAEHSYLSHMYGAVNFVFIDDLSKLPVKIPEIYRKLTT